MSALAAMAFLMAPTLSWAEDAEALISRGIELRKDGRDLDALPLFRKVFELQPTPTASAHLGTCEQAVGLWVPAEAHIQEALSHLQDAWIKKHEGALRAALASVQAKLGSVEFWGTPVGARISIDDQVVASLPTGHWVRVVEGRRAVTIDAPGFLTERRIIEVRPGVLIRQHVALATAAGLTPPVVPLPSNAQGADLAPTGTGSPGRVDSGAQSSPTATDHIYQRWWFWALVGTAAVAAGASAYLLLRSDNCQSSAGASCVKF